ncbi:hypothetical protein [Streptomyces scopuliridis]|uniref:Uncharacterized protein n=1 Tax=Streptomyces scopuliridis RB72 TaxID=1440053 RepID=A0A2T7TEU1_9ACTN|nr:hypothetical protein [Streptomyces scopuliridis]PVE13665.1 hypothetical protein Y717_14635 [Streptomyces scopuliridis RB72]
MLVPAYFPATVVLGVAGAVRATGHLASEILTGILLSIDRIKYRPGCSQGLEKASDLHVLPPSVVLM